MYRLIVFGFPANILYSSLLGSIAVIFLKILDSIPVYMPCPAPISNAENFETFILY